MIWERFISKEKYSFTNIPDVSITELLLHSIYTWGIQRTVQKEIMVAFSVYMFTIRGRSLRGGELQNGRAGGVLTLLKWKGGAQQVLGWF